MTQPPSSGAPTPPQRLLRAIELDREGRHEEGFAELVAAARGGHPVAATLLGARLATGRAAPHDLVEGARWIVRAAQAGFPEALRYQAALMACGLHAPRETGSPDWVGALDCLRAAARRGDTRANSELDALARAGLVSQPAIEAFLTPPAPGVRREAPRILMADGFLPPALCRWWMDVARPRLQRAKVHDAEAGGRRVDDMRSNSGAGFTFLDSGVAGRLTRLRIAAALGHPVACQEAPNVLHYAPGERYEPHFDWLDPDAPQLAGDIARAGQRVQTALVYLNDGFTDGETGFPRLEATYRASEGGLLAFDNTRPDGAVDPQTLHEGLPPASGEKWLLSIWVRARELPLL